MALGIIAAAILHTVSSELLPVTVAYLADNMLDPSRRHLIIGAMFGGLGLTTVAAFVVIWRSPDKNADGVMWLARLLAPLLVLPIAVGLLRHDLADDHTEAIMLALFVIALDRLMRTSLAAWDEHPVSAVRRALAGPLAIVSNRKAMVGLVIALAVGHAIYMSTYAIFAHQRFATYGYDLGQYDNIFTSTLHGRWLAVTTLGWPQNWGELNGHADFGTFYMLPIYALHPRATTLLAMQATVVASAAIPLYLFARNRLALHLAIIFPIAWLLYAPLHGAQLYDIHMQPFGASWAMWAIWAVDARHWKRYWLFYTLAILCREDVSIGLATFGTFMFFTQWRVRTGIASAVVATLYFLVLRFGLMHNQGFADTFKLLYPPGESGFGAVIKTLISNPAFTLKSLITWEKARYLCQILAPLVFLPLRRPLVWLLLVPGFILTLISTAYLPTVQISFQYVCNWATYSFIGAAIVLAAYPDAPDGKQRRGAAVFTLMVASILSSVQWGAYSPHPTTHGGFSDVPFQAPSEADKQRELDLQEVMHKVPEPAAVCVADRLQAHVTWHVETWTLRDGLFDCEYLLFSNLPGDLGNDRGQAAIASGQFEIVERKGGVVLAKKKAPQQPPAP